MMEVPFHHGMFLVHFRDKRFAEFRVYSTATKEMLVEKKRQQVWRQVERGLLMDKSSLQEQLQKKIMILDGAMGTMIQQENLTAEDFGGEELDGCNEILVLTRPDIIRKIHEAYFAAGADIVETNTFGATSVVLAEYGLQDRAREINLAAAKLAIEAANKYSTPEWPRYVAGAMVRQPRRFRSQAASHSMN